jgi:hypothetical protein
MGFSDRRYAGDLSIRSKIWRIERIKSVPMGMTLAAWPPDEPARCTAQAAAAFNCPDGTKEKWIVIFNRIPAAFRTGDRRRIPERSPEHHESILSPVAAARPVSPDVMV